MSSVVDSVGEVSIVDRRVILVEDDSAVAEVATSYLRAAGLLVAVAADGFAALKMVSDSGADLVVLDRMLPGIDGAEVCRRIRRSSSVPIIMLTALGAEDDRIEGLQAGADDYLVKPFSPRELVLRAQSILRRSLTPFSPQAIVSTGAFRLDPSGRTIFRGDIQLPLTGREFDLLEFFLKHPGQVFSRSELLAAVWRWNVGDPSTVTVHVRRLREKIEEDVAAPTLIVTVWGMGYRFDAAR